VRKYEVSDSPRNNSVSKISAPPAVSVLVERHPYRPPTQGTVILNAVKDLRLLLTMYPFGTATRPPAAPAR
jgi:hypothetical protein